MEENYTLLEKANEHRFNLQESEITALRNNSAALEKEISKLVQLKSINQSLNLHNVQKEVQELKQTTSFLKSNQNARNQDFLALYNMTLMADKYIQEEVRHLEMYQNSTFKNVFSLIKNNSNFMENELVVLAHELNISLSNAFSQMNMLSSQVVDNRNKGNYNVLNRIA